MGDASFNKYDYLRSCIFFFFFYFLQCVATKFIWIVHEVMIITHLFANYDYDFSFIDRVWSQWFRERSKHYMGGRWKGDSLSPLFLLYFSQDGWLHAPGWIILYNCYHTLSYFQISNLLLHQYIFKISTLLSSNNFKVKL